VENYHDCEFQDATEGFQEDLDAGDEVPHRPVTPGANPLVSNFLYDYVYCHVVLFWTFSRGSQRSFCLVGCAHRISGRVGDRAGGEAHPAGSSPSRLGSCGGAGRGLHHEPGLLGVGGSHHPHDRQGENFHF
jgi:hypothetical protein